MQQKKYSFNYLIFNDDFIKEEYSLIQRHILSA